MKTTTNLINLKKHRANFKALSALNLARTRGVDLNFMSLLGKRSKLNRPSVVALNLTEPSVVALNLTEPFSVASNLKRACREKSNLARSRGASVKFASSQGGGLNFTRPRGAEFQKGRA